MRDDDLHYMCRTCCYHMFCKYTDEYKARAEEFEKATDQFATELFTPVLWCFYSQPITDKKETTNE